MAESEAPSPSFFRGHWEGWKSFWCERFSFVERRNRYLEIFHNNPPSPSDFEEFTVSDPVYGPIAKLNSKAGNFTVAGAAIGAVSFPAFVWKYSKSPHGAVLALGWGAFFGLVTGAEAGAHWYQLYKLDIKAAEDKYVEWWVKKNEGQVHELVDK